MVNINRVRVAWTGFLGAPGVSTFYCSDPTTLMTPLHDWLYAMANNIPSDVSMQIEGTGETLDVITGALVGNWIHASGTPVVGRSSGVYAAPVGGVATWFTDSYVDGHRLKGKTFVVPMGGASFDTTGQMQTDVHTSLQAATTAFVTAAASTLEVWHRPRTVPAARAGANAAVTAGVLSTKAAVLRSRRD